MCNCENCKTSVNANDLANTLVTFAGSKAEAIASAIAHARAYERYGHDVAANNYRKAARILNRR